MDSLFLLLALVSLLILIIGIIKPSLVIKWGSEEAKTRKKVVITFGSSLIIFFVLFGIISDSQPDTTNNIIEQTSNQIEEIEESNETSAFKLASLEIGHNNPSQSLVNDFDNILNKLAIKCPNESKDKIANYIFIGQDKITDQLGPITLLQVAEGINNSIPVEAIAVISCAEVAAAFVTLTIHN